jgi:hypothetical protein
MVGRKDLRKLKDMKMRRIIFIWVICAGLVAVVLRLTTETGWTHIAGVSIVVGSISTISVAARAHRQREAKSRGG